jgi:hypothetical protein
MSEEIGTEAEQFLCWEYINGIFVAVQSTLMNFLQFEEHDIGKRRHCFLNTQIRITITSHILFQCNVPVVYTFGRGQLKVPIILVTFV